MRRAKSAFLMTSDFPSKERGRINGYLLPFATNSRALKQVIRISADLDILPGDTLVLVGRSLQTRDKCLMHAKAIINVLSEGAPRYAPLDEKEKKKHIRVTFLHASVPHIKRGVGLIKLNCVSGPTAPAELWFDCHTVQGMQNITFGQKRQTADT